MQAMLNTKLLGPISKPRTISNEIAERLILAIANGEMEPGTRLTEGEVADIMQVSRAPAREALQILAGRAVLESTGKRGLKVGNFSPERANEVREVRLALETIALKKVTALAAADDAVNAALSGTVKEMSRLSPRSNALALAQCDLKFHRHIVEFAANSVLLRTWDDLSHHMLIGFCRDWHRKTNKVGEVELHQRLLEFILAGDPTKSEEILQDHFTLA
jgi:DNA-binding GntR family transcriptional regulator